MRARLFLFVLSFSLVLASAAWLASAASASGDASSSEASNFLAAPDPTLGPWALDDEGNVGRIHTVVSGDTLWDISASYLGTAWVWPAVWRDNEDIANPHLIVPGDLIWITAGEMRKITRERADAMIAAAVEREEVQEERVAAIEEEISEIIEENPRIRVAERGGMGFVSPSAVDAATSVVGSPSPRKWLAGGDIVYVGEGEGSVLEGDEFTIFRDAQPVYDLEGGKLLGYHVDILGWLVVRQVEGDSATAEIRESRSEIVRGDRMIPRVVASSEVEVLFTPEATEGNIVFIPDGRAHVAEGDFVYLNRGSSDGLDLGSKLEVYQPGSLRDERVKAKQVMTPDRSEASLVVVEVKPNTSVAFVTGSRRALEVGDRVRPVVPQVASR